MPGKRLDESKRECVRKLHEYFQKELANGGPLLPLNAIQEDFLKAFDTEKGILNMFGAYPLKDRKLKFRYPRLFFCFVINFIQMVLMVMFLVVKDIRNFLEASHFIIISITFLSKLSLFVMGGKEMEEIEKYLNAINVSDIPKRMRDHVINEEKTRNFMYLPQRLAIIGCVFLQLVGCLLLHNQRPVILNSWSPFDLQNPIYYYSTLLFQAAGFVSSGLPNSSMDIMYYVLLDISCCQMDILMYNLENLDTNRSPSEMYEELRKSIIYHHQIIRFIRSIQQIYSRIIFVQCIGSVSVICFLGFQLAVTVEFPSGRFITLCTFFASMVFQIFCYTWFGQKFLIKSQEVSQACYMSKWNESDIKVQKAMLNVMTRTVKPIVLTAGIFDLTLETFTGILRSAYSYMAVLRTMYSE